ncbi:MAG TPA: dTMP kinase [Candidatus Dormibacteraeota bacterium]
MGEAAAGPGRSWAGRLISFEGIDGAGKSTQVEALVAWLGAQGREVVSVREPGATGLGREVREMVLHRRWDASLDPWAEALLLVAARAQLLKEIVLPALARGVVVVCDRFVDSTLAYQGVARGLGVEPLRRLHAQSCGDVWPDLTVYLELPVAVALRRRDASELPLDRMEAGGGAFLDAVARGFAAVAAAEPVRVARVDAGRPEAVVTAAVLALVAERLAAPR